jgi:hypothetical protein
MFMTVIAAEAAIDDVVVCRFFFCRRDISAFTATAHEAAGAPANTP